MTGTPEQMSRAEQLISDVLAEVKPDVYIGFALMFLLFHKSKRYQSLKRRSDIFDVQADAGVPSTNQGFNSMQPGSEQFIMKVPTNKVRSYSGYSFYI